MNEYTKMAFRHMVVKDFVQRYKTFVCELGMKLIIYIKTYMVKINDRGVFKADNME